MRIVSMILTEIYKLDIDVEVKNDRKCYWRRIFIPDSVEFD